MKNSRRRKSLKKSRRRKSLKKSRKRRSYYRFFSRKKSNPSQSGKINIKVLPKSYGCYRTGECIGFKDRNQCKKTGLDRCYIQKNHCERDCQTIVRNILKSDREFYDKLNKNRQLLAKYNDELKSLIEKSKVAKQSKNVTKLNKITKDIKNLNYQINRSKRDLKSSESSYIRKIKIDSKRVINKSPY
jgi:hypothetical protein